MLQQISTSNKCCSIFFLEKGSNFSTKTLSRYKIVFKIDNIKIWFFSSKSAYWIDL